MSAVRQLSNSPDGSASAASGTTSIVPGVGIAPGARMDRRGPLHAQIYLGDAQRGRHARCIDALALDSVQAIAPTQDEIDLRALVRRPEVRLVVRLGSQDLLGRASVVVPL